jgi:hypothetical protein
MAASHLRRDTNALRTTLSGQLWKRDSTQVIIVAVHPNTITYEFLSGGQSVTQSLDVFLAIFTRQGCGADHAVVHGGSHDAP